MKMFNWIKRKTASPMSSATLLDFFKLGGRARWFGHTYWNFATEAYAKNIIAYHCIKRISESCADIPIKIMVNGKVVDNHPLMILLKRPNPTQGWKTFLREAITHRLISGNSYIHGNIVSTGRIMELKNLRPDRVTILYTAYYEPYEYLYTYYGRVWHFPIEPITQHSEVCHIKEPNPLNDLYGMSPIAAAAMSIDQHNESSEWNKKLLENSARPPGIITIRDKTETAPSMDAEQLALLREELNDKIVGSKNAGKIPILNFDMQWQSLGMSPTDMDWINGKDTSARDICYAFGYPPHLLGLPDNSTYNNMSEAKLALYEETIIPLLQNYLEELSYFINYHQFEMTGVRRNPQEIEIIADLDHVSALIPRRESARATARADLTAGLVTLNEARAESNYPPVTGGDEIMVPVGRLPLNFDATGSMDKSTYKIWLIKQGFDEGFAKKMANLAYDELSS
jgi:HK97 family phage portal protein